MESNDLILINAIDGTIHFPKNLLIQYSDYFKALFNGKFKDAAVQKVTLDDNLVFIKLLLEMVLNKDNILERANVKYILHLADKYLFTHIKLKCEEFLIAYQETFEICKLVKMVYDYNLTILKKHFANLFVDHNAGILPSGVGTTTPGFRPGVVESKLNLNKNIVKILESLHLDLFPFEALELLSIKNLLEFTAKIIDGLGQEEKNKLIKTVESLLDDNAEKNKIYTTFIPSENLLKLKMVLPPIKHIDNFIKKVEGNQIYTGNPNTIGNHNNIFIGGGISNAAYGISAAEYSKNLVAGRGISDTAAVVYGHRNKNKRKDITIGEPVTHYSTLLQDKYDYINGIHRLVQPHYYKNLLLDHEATRALAKLEIIGSIDIAVSLIFTITLTSGVHDVNGVQIQYINGCECWVTGSNKGIVIKCNGTKQKLIGNISFTCFPF